MPNPTDLLLIALLPTPADLARAQAGWYRVPEREAPAVLRVARALALYQPASFGEAGRWQVAWWARVQSVETLLRRDLLPDEPEHRRANDPYLCLRLGPLEPVEPPKRASRGRRLLFVPTLWGRFEAAATLDDLLTPDPRPIADDPLYQIIQQQLTDQGGIPDPNAPHQRRLFDASEAEYEALDW